MGAGCLCGSKVSVWEQGVYVGAGCLCLNKVSVWEQGVCVGARCVCVCEIGGVEEDLYLRVDSPTGKRKYVLPRKMAGHSYIGVGSALQVHGEMGMDPSHTHKDDWDSPKRRQEDIMAGGGCSHLH